VKHGTMSMSEKSMTIIKTKSVQDPIEKSDGTRILATRFHPRIKGFKKGIAYAEWLRGLSPHEELLTAYGEKVIDQRAFAAEYEYSLSRNCGQHTEKGIALSIIARMISKGTPVVTLLCFEPEDGKTFCHRHILKQFLKIRFC